MVIVALDFESKDKTMEFLKLFKNEPLYVKVGLELFYSAGSEIIKEIKAMGHKIFLDLKLHDIPNTVKKAMMRLAQLDVDIINLHASGGIKMMEYAKEGLREMGSTAKLIAVTQLTSTSQEIMNQELLIDGDVITCVTHYAMNAKKAGLDGVVCSPIEVEAIKKCCGKEFLTVTPGIRLTDNAKDDQVRITTPAKAKRLGCDYIVVGRPITAASSPVDEYNEVKKEFLGI